MVVFQEGEKRMSGVLEEATESPRFRAIQALLAECSKNNNNCEDCPYIPCHEDGLCMRIDDYKCPQAQKCCLYWHDRCCEETISNLVMKNMLNLIEKRNRIT